MAWPNKNTVHHTHAVGYRAQCFDPGWAAAGGPGAPITLDLLEVGVDWDADRVPEGRATLLVAPPAAGVRWLSPLAQTAYVDVWVTYDGAETRAWRMWLRRRRLAWPDPGDVQLDCATRDGALARAWYDGTVGG